MSQHPPSDPASPRRHASNKAVGRRPLLRLAGAGGLASALGMPAVLRAAAPTKVKMMLAWLPEGSYSYAFVARDKGFWLKRGLDVEIARGYGSLAAAQAVADGQIDFGMSNPASLVLLGAKGVDLRMIGLMDYSPFMAVGLLKDSPIHHPKDLEGCKVGQTMSSSDAAFFQVFCKRNDVDISKVQRVSMDAKIRNQSLGQRRVDAITGLVSSMLPSLGSLGIETRYMLYDSYGVGLYGNIGIAALPQMVAQKPAICQAFMDGLVEGLGYTLTNPEAAQQVFLKAVPELSMTSTGPAFARLGMAVQRASVLSSSDPKTHGLGWADPVQLQKMAELVMTYQAAPGDKMPDLSQLFSNRFAGGTQLSAAEWTAAAQATAGVQKLIEA